MATTAGPPGALTSLTHANHNPHTPAAFLTKFRNDMAQRSAEEMVQGPLREPADSTQPNTAAQPVTAPAALPLAIPPLQTMAEPAETLSGMAISNWMGDAAEPPMDIVNGGLADLELYAAEKAAPPPSDTQSQPMQAFAKLQFPDGDFYVNTYAVELGRDQSALKQEVQRRKMDKRRKGLGMKEEEDGQDQAQEGEPLSLAKHMRLRDQGAMSASNVSEAGGIMGIELYSGSEDGSKVSRRRRRRKLQSESSTHSQSIAPANLHSSTNDLVFTSQLFAGGSINKELADSISGFPIECPFIPIHPQAGAPMKVISRKHIRIEYSTLKECWELRIIGTNGAFHNGLHHKPGDVVDLRHGSEILIQGIRIIFQLPDNARDDEEHLDSFDSDSGLSSPGSSPLGDEPLVDEADSDVSSALSDNDDDRPLKHRTDGTPQREGVKLKLSLSKRRASESQKKLKKEKPAKAAKQPKQAKKQPSDSPPKSDKKKGKERVVDKTEPAPEAEDNVNQPADVRTTIEDDDTPAPLKESPGETPSAPPAELPPGSILAGLAPEEIPQKRKGPGRPPKNGVMSKRDEAIIKRKKKDLQKAGKEIPPLHELLAMARAEAGSTVKKDKPDDVDGDDQVRPTIEAGQGRSAEASASAQPTDQRPDANGQSQPAEDSKPRRAVKSPSPQKPESEYTEEELKKPPRTYVVLIHEAISKSPQQAMDLQQIYDAIQKMYPFYKYRSQTNGWQSSIRHNLISSEAFEEAGKIGKGRLWKTNPNFPIDKEKKRNLKPPTPPPSDRPAQQNYGFQSGPYVYGSQGYPAYVPSPYGTPYAPTTTLANGARPATFTGAQQRPAQYSSPYAANPTGQTHVSPYGPVSRPPYAQNAAGPNPSLPNGATPAPARGAQSPYTAVNGTQPGQPGSIQRPAQVNSQPAPQTQTGTPQPQSQTQPPPQIQQPQQSAPGQGIQSSIDQIVSYRRTYVSAFPESQRAAAQETFRLACNRLIDRTKQPPFVSAEEEKLYKTLSDIAFSPGDRTGTPAAPASPAPAGPSSQPAPPPTTQTQPVAQAPSGPATPTQPGPATARVAVPPQQLQQQHQGNGPAPPPPTPMRGVTAAPVVPSGPQTASQEKELVQALQTATDFGSDGARAHAATAAATDRAATATPSTAGSATDPINLDAPRAAAGAVGPSSDPSSGAGAGPGAGAGVKRAAEDDARVQPDEAKRIKT